MRSRGRCKRMDGVGIEQERSEAVTEKRVMVI
jgi:hypothetical protein